MKELSVAALVSVLVLPSQLQAQDKADTAFVITAGCRAMLTSQYHDEALKCLTIVSTLRNVGMLLNSNVKYCVPQEVMNGQAAQVVVNYIDRIPARQHEAFLWLAMEALRASWPCR